MFLWLCSTSVADEHIQVDYLGSGRYRMTVGEASFDVSGSLVCNNNVRQLTASVNGCISRSQIVLENRDIHIFTQVRFMSLGNSYSSCNVICFPELKKSTCIFNYIMHAFLPLIGGWCMQYFYLTFYIELRISISSDFGKPTATLQAFAEEFCTLVGP